MYDLTVHNNFRYPVQVEGTPVKGPDIDVTVAQAGGHDTFKNLGFVVLTTPGLGQMLCFDLGDKKLPGYDNPSETWGVLFRFHQTEVYYRYEGQGALTITINEIGLLEFKISNGTAIEIQLQEITIN